MHIEGAPSYSKVRRRTGECAGVMVNGASPFHDSSAFECSRLLVSAGVEEWRMELRSSVRRMVTNAWAIAV